MQKIFPASRNMRDFEKFLQSSYEVGVFLDLHISQLKNVHRMAQAHCKKMFYHMDLIHGLKNDDYATEFVCQEIKPAGLISTKASVIMKAKQKGVLSVQRVFLLDSQALEKNMKIVSKTQPDFLEVLPGAMPWIIEEIKDMVNIPILAGGFIRTPEEVDNALKAGATGITTSNVDLWNYYEEKGMKSL
ncbi:glycerol-3-phosphate responsive antiterminator [Peribacillus tepidiphilus]|uniref:glycerol-3-phosphate responsive antiterminator n=1 Tax=Peribacillus tepidiphilus TaxID=2652445 RepID=UPI001292B42F|nr:glycerol-3-phosphate responsive antiterminator [Peribacillus tepidiphilus]